MNTIEGDDVKGRSGSEPTQRGAADGAGHSAAGPAKLKGDAIPGLAPARRSGPPLKTMVALGAMVLSMLAFGGFMASRFISSRANAVAEKAPDVASMNSNKLRVGDPKATMPTPISPEPASAPGPRQLPGTSVPAIKDGEAKPIAIIPNGTGARPGATGPATAAGQKAPANPADAPVFAGTRSAGGSGGGQAGRTGGQVDSQAGASGEEDEQEAAYARAKQRLADRKQQLEDMLAQAQGKKSTPGVIQPSTGWSGGQAPVGGRAGAAPDAAAAKGLFGGSMEQSSTARAYAQMLPNAALTIPKGTLFSCALKTKVVTATSGLVGCLVQRNVYGHDGKIVLLERGSHLDGEYRMVSVRPGLTRVPVIWTRVLTPAGVTVDLESPATGQLGESGIGGYVDNRWPERIGAAVLVSMINDVLKLAIDSKSDSGTGDSSRVYLPATNAQGNKLAEEVLKSTINIPPLLYANQAGVVGVYVARDLDFTAVYKLQPQ